MAALTRIQSGGVQERGAPCPPDFTCHKKSPILLEIPKNRCLFFFLCLLCLTAVSGHADTCLVNSVRPSAIPVNQSTLNPLDSSSLKNPTSIMRLPENTNQIANYSTVRRALALALSDKSQNQLMNNGFVILGSTGFDEIISAYKTIKAGGIPLFVTSDSILHLFHLRFTHILKDIEKNILAGQLKNLSASLMKHFLNRYGTSSGVLKEAAKRNTAFFAVALKLQSVEASIPQLVADDVEKEIYEIENHRGFSPSSIFRYLEDFSQYAPRGHYAGDDILERFFKAMMWYGRMGFILKAGLISEEDALIQTLQACLIAESLNHVMIEGETATVIWDRIYALTGFFVGLSDDLTPMHYIDVLSRKWGDSFDLSELIEKRKRIELKAELARVKRSGIYGGTAACRIDGPLTAETVDRCFDDNRGMRFMGQRFVYDAFVFQNLVNLTYTGNDSPFTLVKAAGRSIRGFPRGLDIMAVMGSGCSKRILDQEGHTHYNDYHVIRSRLEMEFSNFFASKTPNNIYWDLLFCLKTLITVADSDGPAFMQTDAWREKQLQTALASWAELRHDTVLYAKQSYTPGAALPPKKKAPPGYVEPVPRLYKKLQDLTLMMERTLSSFGALNRFEKARLRGLNNLLKRLECISIDEIRGKPLSNKDVRLLSSLVEIFESVGASESEKAPIIVDVHTDLNSGKVLEEGVGYFNIALVLWPAADDQFLLCAGPTQSYYEFLWPMSNRLTDDQWREMLQS